MNLASMYCDYLIVMKDGIIKEVGTIDEVINTKMLKDIFAVNAYVVVNPINKKITDFIYAYS